MTFLELVRFAMREAGITQTDPEPQSLSNLTGLTLKFKNWISDAWADVQIENDQTELRREWFYTTINPRFYFDLDEAGFVQPFPGQKIVGLYSGCSCEVTNVIIVNNGLWADGTAQGFIEFQNFSGQPLDLEPFAIDGTTDTCCRFIRWGDYKLDDQVEMGTSWISNLEDVWWDTLRISGKASDNTIVGERPLPFIDYPRFVQRYDLNQCTLGFPVIVTETPDNGTRIALYPPPDKPYTIGGYYYKNNGSLVDDTDTPSGLKSMYHPMIAWRAVMYYGQYMQQPSIIAEAQMRYAVFKKKLDREYELPVTLRPFRLY